MSTTNYEECPKPIKIGAGSFATIYVISGGPVAYKEVSQVNGADALRLEYDALNSIYRHCNTDSLFAIPRALAFNDPLAAHGGFSASSSSPPSLHRRRSMRPIVTPGIMTLFTRAVYAMDRVFALPYDARAHLARLYFPVDFPDGPALCRLYFGKDYTNMRPSRFVNSQNFPLDEHRYTELATNFTVLPDASVIVRGIGQMLARLHYKAHVDARDVEFVLGGDGAGSFTLFLIDFNQVRNWNKSLGTTEELVSAFFANDPYYPRPRPSEVLYQEFKEAYLAECSDEDGILAHAFISAIETFQAHRDQSIHASS